LQVNYSPEQNKRVKLLSYQCCHINFSNYGAFWQNPESLTRHTEHSRNCIKLLHQTFFTPTQIGQGVHVAKAQHRTASKRTELHMVVTTFFGISRYFRYTVQKMTALVETA
jgi:hypothetical protein